MIHSGRRFAETVVGLHAISVELSIRPQDSTAYALRLYPITLERSALLAQLACEEMYALEGVRTAWEEERERIEDEWKKGQEKVRERLLEGIEERRRKAREEKDGEGILGEFISFHKLYIHDTRENGADASLDSQSRPLITRKLRNKMAASPPPSSYVPNQVSTVLTNTIIPSPNPNSLSVDELPSPFPLPLLSSLLPNGYGGSNARRKTKGSTVQPQALTGLGKAITQLSSGKEGDIESDLGEIRRGVKRRRTAVNTHKT